MFLEGFDDKDEKRAMRDRDPEIRQRRAMQEYLGITNFGIFGGDEESMREHDAELFGFENEDPMTKALANLATHMLGLSDTVTVGEDEFLTYGYDDEVGMVVPATSSDVADYGAMVNDIMGARTESELCEIAEVYKDMPGAIGLARAVAMKKGYSEFLKAV